MANANREDFTTPVGRLVQGSMYVPNTKDAEGKPLVFKTGDKAGQPRTDFYFAIAIPKTGEQHWASTEWGAKIWAVGHKGFTAAQCGAPTFAWKVVDGDSLTPNRAGTIPANCDGFAGCWILKFNGSQAPALFKLNATGKTESFSQENGILPGDYVQVRANVSDNQSQQQPGVFLNHNMVCWSGYGDRIILGVDPDSVGFGAAPLPAGASLTPKAGFIPPTASVANPPPPPHAAGVPSPAVPAPVPNVPAPAPHTAILTPGAVPPPPAPPAAVASKVPVMTALANGLSYESYIAGGWTHTALVQYGMVQP